MLPPLVYESLGVAIAAALLVPAVFLAVCRHSLEWFSRKALLERLPEARREAWERSISHREEYRESLRLPEFFLRLAIAVVLFAARWAILERMAWEDGQKLLWKDVGFRVLGLNLLCLVLELFAGAVVLLHLLPALIARAAAEGWLLRFLPIVERVHRVVRPLQSLGERAVRGLSVMIGADRERSSADMVEEEILSAVEEGQREGLLESRDIDMIESIMEYGDVEVSEVMTPRTEMVALDLECPLERNLEIVTECGHSRIPVYRGSKDRIEGVLYVKDLQRYLIRGEQIRFEEIIRKPYFVSERSKIGELLQEFRRHRQHLAVVLDEHGGTAGLVTIEDILEEIVGEISDEHDREERLVRRVARDVVEVDTSIHIDDLNEALGLRIPEGETYDTLAGWALETLGRVPGVGDTFHYGGIRFEVADADERRVHRLRIQVRPRPGASASTPAGPATGGAAS